MKIYKIFIINCFFFIFVSELNAADAQQLFQEANQAYTGGNYASAAEKYETILKQNIFSKDLYFNLGNSYYRLNQIGKAVLNYERAYRLTPSDGDIQQNLTIARSRIVEDIEPVSSIFLIRWWRGLRELMSVDAWSICGVLFLWIGIGGIALWLLGTERLLKKRGFITGTAMIPLSILLFLLANNAKNEAYSTQYAIIISRETPFRTSPDANAAPSALLHEGIKIQVLDKIANLSKVRLPNGEEGWLEENTIEKI